jgi:hypothetical protein
MDSIFHLISVAISASMVNPESAGLPPTPGSETPTNDWRTGEGKQTRKVAVF